MNTKETKCRQMLYYSGQAFVVFGIWGIVKFALQFYLNPFDWSSIELLDGVSKQMLQVFSYSVLGGFMAVDILIRLYIGMSAIKESNGKRKRIIYLIIAAAYMIWIAAWFLPSGYDTNYAEKISLATIFFDTTNIIALVLIIYNSWELRKLRE